MTGATHGEQAPAAARRGIRRDRQEGRTELSFYRHITTRLLRRYLRVSLETGRLPSLLGRECFFRARSSSRRMYTFEDGIIFVYDVEQCLKRLDAFSQQIIGRVILQEHTEREAAEILGCRLRTLERRLPEALDELSEILLSVGLLEPLEEACGKACQEEEAFETGASH
jgi:DNA-directed RNA polymerase specialized sigma24 family protein